MGPLRVARDRWVVIDYVLYDEDGDVIEATDEPPEGEQASPIAFVHGYGALVPGLEDALIGMAPGETRDVVVPPDRGYGAWDEEKELWVDRAELPPEVEVGDELSATDERGADVVLRVVELTDTDACCDTNHPLAGETVRFDVVVREVRPATAEELAAARAEAPRAALPILRDPAAGSTHAGSKVVTEKPHRDEPGGAACPALGDDEQ